MPLVQDLKAVAGGRARSTAMVDEEIFYTADECLEGLDEATRASVQNDKEVPLEF